MLAAPEARIVWEDLGSYKVIRASGAAVPLRRVEKGRGATGPTNKEKAPLLGGGGQWGDGE